jgi:RNA polymerase sigma-54 factor
MELGLQMNVGMRLEQKLTPQMIQSLKILQVTTIELEQMIKIEMETNPVLEMDAEEWDDERSEDRDDSGDDYDSEDPLDELNDRSEESLSDWEEYLYEQNDMGPKTTNSYEQPDDDGLERQPVYAKGLSDHLLEQVTDRKLEPEVREVLEYLIDSLDEDGLLRRKDDDEELLPLTTFDDELIDEIEAVIRMELDVFAARSSVRDAFHVLWSLEPAGIGGRSLQESLLIQWRRRGGGSELATRILTHAFDMLMKVQVSALARAMETNSEAIQAALREISVLDPKPGKGLAPTAAPAVLPDLLVWQDQRGQLRIELNDKHLPTLRISQSYQDLIFSKKTNNDDKKFLRKKIEGANWLIRSIEQRRGTMLKVMHAIVELQEDFFTEGPSALKPMILQDVADKIEMHISTVNRVTNGKYVQTPYGVFELKQFFSSKVEQEDGSDASASAIREAIKEAIEKENPSKPLSDEALTAALDQMGFKVARRTVAKYREQMGINPARLRKKF